MDAGAQRTVAVIGGGVSGGLFAAKLSAAQPNWKVLLIEDALHPGRGLAYGACGPHHLLNVPVSRMEVGLAPRFSDWLHRHPDLPAAALEESGGQQADAYVPRQLFGDYLQQRIGDELIHGGSGLRHVQGRAVALSKGMRRLRLADGQSIAVDKVVLAMGHFFSSLPFKVAPSQRVISDPWAPGLGEISPDATVLLVGSGLTMVDTVLSLRAQGHKGVLYAVSRHGLLPGAHKGGGTWPAFLETPASPRKALRAVRSAVQQAQAQGIPWQRVFDAACGLWSQSSSGTAGASASVRSSCVICGPSGMSIAIAWPDGSRQLSTVWSRTAD